MRKYVGAGEELDLGAGGQHGVPVGHAAAALVKGNTLGAGGLDGGHQGVDHVAEVAVLLGLGQQLGEGMTLHAGKAEAAVAVQVGVHAHLLHDAGQLGDGADDAHVAVGGTEQGVALSALEHAQVDVVIAGDIQHVGGQRGHQQVGAGIPGGLGEPRGAEFGQSHVNTLPSIV